MINKTFLNILIFSFTYIAVCNCFTIKGGKCQLQEQYCDIMDPQKQCCPGTSCGVKRNDDHVANVCVVCRDLGQPCNATKLCCMGLKCQKITKFTSVCNPHSHTPFVPYKINTNDDSDDNDNKYY